MPALQILDHAMAGHQGTDPDFHSFGLSADGVVAYVDELEPPSFLSEIIRRAFAPQLDPGELSLLDLDADTADAKLQERIAPIGAAWQEGLMRFAARYQLWETSEDG